MWCPKGCQLVRDEKTANERGLGTGGPGSPADEQRPVDPARRPARGLHRVCPSVDTQAARGNSGYGAGRKRSSMTM